MTKKQIHSPLGHQNAEFTTLGASPGDSDIPAALHRPALERERALAHLGGAAMKKENKGRETEGWSKSMEGRSEGAQK